MSEISSDWSAISLDLLKQPDNLQKWQELVKTAENLNGGIYKASSPEDKELLRKSYDGILAKFPLLSAYWVNYANWEFQLGHTDVAESLYCKAFVVLPYCVDVWTAFLRFKIATTPDIDGLLAVFEVSRLRIGSHFHSHEFYDLYLQVLKGNGEMGRYYSLLRRILEIPLYHFGKYFQIWFKALEQIDENSVDWFLSSVEKSKFSELSNSEISVKLKKIFTDVYIATQFNVYEAYKYERKIKRPFFHISYLSTEELANWDNYLTYVQVRWDQTRDLDHRHVIATYERCVIATGLYPQFWLKYANFLLSLDEFESAKDVLKRGIYCSNSATNYRLKLKLVDLEIYFGHVIKARDMILELMRVNYDHIPFYLKFLAIEKILHQKDEDKDEYLAELVELKLSNGQFDLLFGELVKLELKSETILGLFEKYCESKSSWTFWKNYLEFLVYHYEDEGSKKRVKDTYLAANEKLEDEFKCKLVLWGQLNLNDEDSVRDGYWRMLQ